MRLWIASGLAGVVAASACSGSTKDDTRPDACVAAAETVCDRLMECSPFWFAVLWDGAVACQNDLHDRCRAEADAPGSGVTDQYIQACAASQSESCELVVLSEASEAGYYGGLSFTPVGCQPPAGTLALDAACEFDSQCATSRCRTGADGCKHCVAGLGDGVQCATPAGGFETCAAGLECIETVCRPARYQGDTCTTNAQCAGALACLNGTCAVEPGSGSVGSPCGSGTFCDPLTGLVCSSTATCQQLVLSAAGQPCGESLVCRAGLECSAEDGVCAKAPNACVESEECNGGLCRWRGCSDPTTCP